MDVMKMATFFEKTMATCEMILNFLFHHSINPPFLLIFWPLSFISHNMAKFGFFLSFQIFSVSLHVLNEKSIKFFLIVLFSISGKFYYLALKTLCFIHVYLD